MAHDVLEVKKQCTHLGIKGHCYWCDGTNIYYSAFDPDEVKYNFSSDKEKEVEYSVNEIEVEIPCECGNNIREYTDGSLVCKCGRVYRITVQVDIDTTHADDLKYWQREYGAVIGEG